MSPKGLLVVIEGIDGSGKTTQVELLARNLKEQGIDTETIKFPRYEDNIYGNLIKRYLEGELGEIDKVNSYLIALAYASDRSLARDLINGWLSDGKVVICDRYVSASKAHLAANLEDGRQSDFIKWVDELEYKVNNLPKEDLTIFLSASSEEVLQNIDSSIKDIHEQSSDHLKKAYDQYLKLSQNEENWEVVKCFENGVMRTKEDVVAEIIKIVKSKLPT